MPPKRRALVAMTGTARNSRGSSAVDRVVLTKSISAPNCSNLEGKEKGVTELAELRQQLALALASNHSHVRSIHALRRTVARLRGENAELTRLCVAAEFIDEQSIYSSDEEETTEEGDEAEDPEAGDGGAPQPVSLVVAPGVSAARGRGAHAAPLVVWPPSDLDPNDVSIVPTFDFGSLGMIRCDCHEVIGVMGCVCVGQCADLLKQEYALANDPNPDGGGFNDDGDWRGTNKEQRYRCYRAGARWLGYTERRRLPRCFEAAVRAAWPEPSGVYVGYHL